MMAASVDSAPAFPERYLPRTHSCRGADVCNGLASEVMVGSAGAFGGDHERAERTFGRAGGSKYLALPGLEDPLQYFTALAGFWIGDADAADVKAHFGVEIRVSI